MVVDLVIHDFDDSRWLGGEVERLYAQRSRSVGGPAQYVQAILRFRSGAIALVEGGWAYPPGVFRTALDLSGTDGLIEWNSDQPSPVLTFLPPKPNDTASAGLPESQLGQGPYSTQIQIAYSAFRL